MIDSKVRSIQYLKDIPSISDLFNVLDRKGQGTFASVFSVQDKEMSNDGNDDSAKQEQKTYALKMIIPTVEIRRIENEVRILRRLG